MSEKIQRAATSQAQCQVTKQRQSPCERTLLLEIEVL